MTRSQAGKLALAAAATTFFVSVGFALTQQSLPPDAGSTCAGRGIQLVVRCRRRVPERIVKPANSVLFPDVPNCSFYKWSEQMFPWLTSPAPPRYGRSGGLIMNTPAFYDVSLPDSSGRRHFCRIPPV